MMQENSYVESHHIAWHSKLDACPPSTVDFLMLSLYLDINARSLVQQHITPAQQEDFNFHTAAFLAV